MKVEIITTGDEVLSGTIVDTNTAWISEKCYSLGHEIVRHTSVRDDKSDISSALKDASKRADIVIVSGGLGPTADDITIESFVEAFNLKLILNENILSEMKDFFGRIGREMSKSNEKQAYVPEGASVLPNPVGTAPGIFARHANVDFYFLPGVPKELYRIFDDSIMPVLAKSAGGVVREKVFHCFGIAEATIDEKLQGANLFGTRLSFRVKFPEIILKLVARAKTNAEADDVLCNAACELRSRLQDVIYAEGDLSLPEVVGRLLADKKMKIAVAESCTGGNISNEITNVAGASEYFDRAVVTYSNRSKQELLSVSEEILKAHGAVSKETAMAMAEGVRKISAADIGVSVTGIAGPGGGTPEKPVGLVFIGISTKEGTKSFEYRYARDRMWFKGIVAATALDLVRKYLQGNLLLAK